MIGMGDSEKLPDSGPDRYTYAEQCNFLFALWKKLGVDKDVVFVLHDSGSLLGFDWTRQHPERGPGYRLHGGACSAHYLGGFP
jgi:haloalkane dehalogenase